MFITPSWWRMRPSVVNKLTNASRSRSSMARQYAATRSWIAKRSSSSCTRSAIRLDSSDIARRLLACPVRFALLGKCLRTFHVVVGAEQALYAALAIPSQGVVHGVLQTVERGFLRQPHTQWRTFQNLAAPAFGGGHQIGQQHYFVDQADAIRLLSTDLLAGQQH